MSQSANNAESTYIPRDYVAINTASDVVFSTLLGYLPRAIRADAAGSLVFRCVETPSGDPDITMNLVAGEVLTGFFTHVKSSSTATIHAAK